MKINIESPWFIIILLSVAGFIMMLMFYIAVNISGG